MGLCNIPGFPLPIPCAPTGKACAAFARQSEADNNNNNNNNYDNVYGAVVMT